MVASNNHFVAFLPWMLALACTTSMWVSAGDGSGGQGTRMTREQHRILSHLSIVYLDDGNGNAIETIRISGVNVQIVNAMGETASTNGAGNLIVGYNDDHPVGDPEERSGSHNVVVGDDQTFTSYGGLVAGRKNLITAPYASVTGGALNTASAYLSSVSGGQRNHASGSESSVTGGFGGTASGWASCVSGGSQNVASGSVSTVGGGRLNTASGEYASVSGGLHRIADGRYDWAAGSLYEDDK